MVSRGLFTHGTDICAKRSQKAYENQEHVMRLTRVVLAVTIAGLAFAGGSYAQSYVPTPRIVKPNVLPKPLANRLIKRPTAEEIRAAKQAEKPVRH